MFATLRPFFPHKGFKNVMPSDEHPSKKEAKIVRSIDKFAFLCPKLETNVVASK